jgi:hypothetical protein
MDNNDKIKMIGLTPSQEEQVKINFISEVYNLTSARVIKNMMYNKITLNEFYDRAKKYNAKRSDDETDKAELPGSDMVIV